MRLEGPDRPKPLFHREDALNVVPNAQYVVEHAGMLFAEHLHLSLGVEPLGAAFNLASMVPWAAAAYGVAVLDASYATSPRTLPEPLAYLNHFFRYGESLTFPGMIMAAHILSWDM